MEQNNFYVTMFGQGENGEEKAYRIRRRAHVLEIEVPAGDASHGTRQSVLKGHLIDEGPNAALFELERRSVAPSGSTFCPADGYAEIRMVNGALRIRIQGPHFHFVELNDGIVRPESFAIPPFVKEQGLNWTIEAKQSLVHELIY